MGRVKNLIISRDGRIRAAEVDVMTNDAVTTLTRPISKLYPVEFSTNTEVDNEHLENNDGEVRITFVDEKRWRECSVKSPVLQNRLFVGIKRNVNKLSTPIVLISVLIVQLVYVPYIYTESMVVKLSCKYSLHWL